MKREKTSPTHKIEKTTEDETRNETHQKKRKEIDEKVHTKHCELV